MKISIKATNIDLTPKIKDYVEKKMNTLNKYFNNILEASVEIGQNSLHHKNGDIYFCRANIKVPNKILRVEKTEQTLVKSIEKTRDHLKVVLRRYKGRVQGRPMQDNQELDNKINNMEDEE